MKTLENKITRKSAGDYGFQLGRAFLIFSLAALVWAANPAAKADQLPNVFGDYSITVIEPPPDTTQVWFVFINEKGSIVMQYFTEPPAGQAQGHTAILEDGVWKVIDVPGSYWCGVSNPSAAGRVGMVYVLSPEDDANGIWHNAIYQRGTYTPLPAHPEWQYGIQEINEHGLMTGLAFCRKMNFSHRAKKNYPNPSSWIRNFFQTS